MTNAKQIPFTGAIVAVVVAVIISVTATFAATSRSGEVKVPALVGMQLHVAKQELSELGLGLHVNILRMGPLHPPPEGQVVWQSPLANTSIESGKSVTLNVYGNRN